MSPQLTLSTWLCREDLQCRRKVPHHWLDWWFGGEKCTLHLYSILLAISSMIFLLETVEFIKDYYFRHPFLLLLKAHWHGKQTLLSLSTWIFLVWTSLCQSDITQKNSRNHLTDILLPEILKVKIILGRVSLPCGSQVLDTPIPALPLLLWPLAWLWSNSWQRKQRARSHGWGGQAGPGLAHVSLSSSAALHALSLLWI